ncbi:cytochrome c554 family protein [bacterium]|nr:cytochrome c554 family protein [bacterium]
MAYLTTIILFLISLLLPVNSPAANINIAENVPAAATDYSDHEMFDFKKLKVSQFIEPEFCAECHPSQFEQWNGSMHSKAFSDPLWRAATKLFLKEATTDGEILEMKACVKCHTPLGFRSGEFSSPEEDFDQLTNVAAQGIFCNWCHNISKVKHIGDSAYEVEAGGGEDDPSTMLGPYKDADSPFHPTAYSELHTRSEFCGLCHNVSHVANGLPLERTFDEWRDSPYNTGDPATTVRCQDCHMRQRPGVPATGKTARPDNPGQACEDGPVRPHLPTHYFVGGNTIIPKLMGSELHSEMAVARLQNAADMEIILENTYTKGTLSRVKVKVTNSGAGHYLPTGLTEIRQMWLHVTIADANGKTIYSSGHLQSNGDIEENAVKYVTQLGNSKGEPVVNVALADRVLFDNRIPPKGFALEQFAFVIPEGAISPLTVKAGLKYRSISPSLAQTLLREKTPEIAAVLMVTAQTKVPFQ